MTLDERLSILRAAEFDPEYRKLFLEAIDDPETGDAFFINTCVVTFDPRKEAMPEGGLRTIGYVPFLLWPAQEKAAGKIGYCIDNEKDCGGEKSRDMGLTWIFLGCLVRRWLRSPAFTCLIGTMTKDLIDDEKNPASLFWKIDCILKNLPSWLVPRGFNKRKHRGPDALINPENGNTVNGNAPTARFAVGDRKSCIYFDDWAQWSYGEEAWELAKASTNCRLASWTANGMNHAYDLRFGKGKFVGVEVEIVNIHWSSDPRKMRFAVDPYTGKEYNVWLRETIGDPEAINPVTGHKGIPGRISYQRFLQDYEMKYELADMKTVYGLQLIRSRRGKFPYHPRLPLFSLWDYGRSNRTAIWWVQFDPKNGRLRVVDFIEASGQEIRYYVPFALGRPEGGARLQYEDAYGSDELELIEEHTSWQVYDYHKDAYLIPYADHFGDPTGANATLTDTRSVVEQLADAGIVVTSRWDRSARGHTGRIEDARVLLARADFNTENPRVERGVDHLTRYRFDDTEKKPVHDVHSDAATSFEYGCVNLRPYFDDWDAGKRVTYEKGRLAHVVFDGVHPSHREGERAAAKDRRKAFRETFGEEGESMVYTLSGKLVSVSDNEPITGYTDEW